MPSLDRDGVRKHQRRDPRQQPVLHGTDPLMQGVSVIAGQDRHRFLRDDRPAVKRGIDEMHGHAGDRHPVLERITNRVRPGKRGQQRRMGVEDAPGECLEHDGPDASHIPREQHEVGASAREHVAQRRVVAAGHQGRVDALFHRPVKCGARPVGEHEHDRSRELAAHSRRVQRSQVRPCPGHPHGDPSGRAGHATDSSCPST